MKKYLLSLTLLLLSLSINAQAPQGFNYQATVRNASGDLILNQNITFRLSILQGSVTGDSRFTEEHSVQTDNLGQIAIVIGEGTTTQGVFSEIDWSAGNYFLSIELDTGNGFISQGTTQFLSVPYALYAKNSGNNQYPTNCDKNEIVVYLEQYQPDESGVGYDLSQSYIVPTCVLMEEWEYLKVRANGQIPNASLEGPIIIENGIYKAKEWARVGDCCIFGNYNASPFGPSAPRIVYVVDAYYLNQHFMSCPEPEPGDGDSGSGSRYVSEDGAIHSVGEGPNIDPYTARPFPNLSSNCSRDPDRMFINNICTTYMDWENPLLDLNSMLADMDNLFQIINVDEEAIYVWDRSKWDTSGMTDKNQILQWGGFVRSNAAGDWVDINESYLPNVREYATNASNWDVTGVTDMSNMFEGLNIAQDISQWNVSNVTNMAGMFYNSTFYRRINDEITTISPEISNWDVSNVTDMTGMFFNASAFNQDLSGWDVSNVTNMAGMFVNASAFNQDLSGWDVSNVTDMSNMFFNAGLYNQDLSLWNVEGVLNCGSFSTNTPQWILPQPNFTNCNPN